MFIFDVILQIGKLQALFILLPTSKGQFSDYSSSEIQDSVSLSNERYLRDISLRYARSSKPRFTRIGGDSKCTCVCKKCKVKKMNQKCCKCTNCDSDKIPYDYNTNNNLIPDDNMAADPGESHSLLMVPFPMPYPVPILLAPVPNVAGPEQGPGLKPGPEHKPGKEPAPTGPVPEAPTESPVSITNPPQKEQNITELKTTPPPKPIEGIRSGDIKKNLDIFCNEYGDCFKSFSNPKSTIGLLDLERRNLEISYNIRPTISVNNVRGPISKRYGLIELPELVAEKLRPTKQTK